MKLNNIMQMIATAEVAWKPLGEVATIYGGLTGKNKSDFENGNAKYITYKNIFGNIEIDYSCLEFVKVSSDEKQHEVKYGDILFTGSSEIAEEAGMSSAVTTKFDEPIYLNSFSFGVRFNDGVNIIPEFAKYLFRSNLARKQIIKTASGVTRFNISKERFKKIQIPIPPLELQKNIVQVLDAMTALTSELTSELTLRQKQYQYYRDLLLDLENAANPFYTQNVVWKTLGKVAENLDSVRKPIASGLRESGDIPYYGASGIVDYVKDYIFDGDYLLVSEDGANLVTRNTPIAFSISGKSWVNNHAHVLKFNSYAERRFVEFYLNNIDLMPYISGAAQPKLNKQNLNSIKVPSPSLETQTQIVEILDKFDRLTHSISDGLPKEIALRRKQYEYYLEKLLDFPKV